MTLYGPLPAQHFLQLLQRLASGKSDRLLLKEVLDAIIQSLDAERGALIRIKAPGGMLALAARHQDGTDLPHPLQWVSHFAVKNAMAAPERFHHASQAGRDRRYWTHGNARGARRVQAILALAPAAGAPAGLVVYLDHRFKGIEFSEHRRITVEHWLSLLQVALRMRAQEIQLRRQVKKIHRGHLAAAEAGAADAGKENGPDIAAPASAGHAAVDFFGMLSAAPKMLQIFDTARRLGQSDIPVMVSGETGTGKGMLIQAIHQASRRAGAPCLSVNCGALPDALLESELFGHLQGSFTGAGEDRPGLLHQAEGGSLFLDEVGDMSQEMQKKLLRFLENQRFRPIGGSKEVQCNVRILSSTRLDLKQVSSDEAVRSDLYYRLCGIGIHLPPLRERREDIAALARFFLSRVASDLGVPEPELTPAAMQWLDRYPWPGNVRELENLIRQLAALGFREVRAGDLALLAQQGPRAAVQSEKRFTLDEAVFGAEHIAIRNALTRCAGNKSKTAQLLGITRKALYRRLHKYGFLKRGDRGDAASEDISVSPPHAGGTIAARRPGKRFLEES